MMVTRQTPADRPTRARAPSAHVELFGPVAIVIGDDRVEPSGYPAQLLALLAANASPVAATQLLDHLWPEAPRSGLNVVQRHLSALRRQLRSRGHPTLADRLVVHRRGAYHLDRDLVSTDLDLMGAEGPEPCGPTTGTDDAPPRWWLEPLVGLPWEPFVALRARLDRLAVVAAHRWLATTPIADDAAVIAAVDELARRHPGDDLLWTALRNALRRTDATGAGHATDARTAIRRHRDGTAEANLPRLRAVGPAMATWLSGDAAGSLAVLDTVEPALDADVARRVRRWLSTLDPADGLVRLLFSDLVTESRGDPRSAERCVVALDAYTLIQDPDGINRARRELAAATHPAERLRSLRVLTFALLGAPLDEGLPEALDELGTIDDPEAKIEWLRFRATLALRQGRFDTVPLLLDEVGRKLRERYPGVEPWFEAVAWNVLRHCPATRDLPGGPHRPLRLFAHPVNQSVVDLSALWHQLEQGRVTAVTSTMIRQLSTQLTMPAGHATQLLHLLALGLVDAAAERMRPFRGRLSRLPRDALGQLLPVAAARVAVASGDSYLASEVNRALEPYAGEWLGAWPFDLLIAPADEIIASCKAVIGAGGRIEDRATGTTGGR